MDENQEHIMVLMQKEIALMREVLSNMHQEETLLRMNDQFSVGQILTERSQIIQLLSPLREERVNACKNAGKFISENFEIISMRDQLMTLMERINLQNVINERLYHTVRSGSMPKMEEAPKKKKSSIATYDRNL